MPEGVGYGPQNTASTGLNLNYIGDYAYAYSGAISCSDSEKELLNFTTGSEVTPRAVSWLLRLSLQ